jgi:thiol-disulfide isomerase/thioredoxin
MKRFLILCLVALPALLFAQNNTRIIKLNQLLEFLHEETDHIKVVNFWATWCAPCIKELPLLEKLGEERTDVKVTLVSLDLDLDPKPEKVYRFIERRKIKSNVLLLDESNPNNWINQVEKSWSGAIPATIIINGKTGKRKFIERQLHEGDLEHLIAELLSTN